MRANGDGKKMKSKTSRGRSERNDGRLLADVQAAYQLGLMGSKLHIWP